MAACAACWVRCNRRAADLAGLTIFVGQIIDVTQHGRQKLGQTDLAFLCEYFPCKRRPRVNLRRSDKSRRMVIQQLEEEVCKHRLPLSVGPSVSLWKWMFWQVWCGLCLLTSLASQDMFPICKLVACGTTWTVILLHNAPVIASTNSHNVDVEFRWWHMPSAAQNLLVSLTTWSVQPCCRASSSSYCPLKRNNLVFLQF